MRQRGMPKRPHAPHRPAIIDGQAAFAYISTHRFAAGQGACGQIPADRPQSLAKFQPSVADQINHRRLARYVDGMPIDALPPHNLSGCGQAGPTRSAVETDWGQLSFAGHGVGAQTISNPA